VDETVRESPGVLEVSEDSVKEGDKVPSKKEEREGINEELEVGCVEKV